MKGLKLCLTFDFWLPWMLGYDCGWGCNWFDLGPFTLWWWSDSKWLGYDVAVALYRFVYKHFGRVIACQVDTLYFMITGESCWCCKGPKKDKST